jgi:GT2 family glycosyltransferase
MTVILLDDASPDGTAEEVAERFPEVEVLHGTGDLFWNRGMHVAFAKALDRVFDYYLWLNDDTELFENAIDVILASSASLQRQGLAAIVTGATCDPLTGLRTYGGISRTWRWNGVRDTPVQPQPDTSVRCDTMNGNCTLIPRVAAARLGNLEKRFRHHYGDFDYGFRARRAGIGVYVAPGFAGTCILNTNVGLWRSRRASLRSRWKDLMSPKGAPPLEWLLLARRHYGYLWPLYFLSPYVKTLLALHLGRHDNRENKLHIPSLHDEDERRC